MDAWRRNYSAICQLPLAKDGGLLLYSLNSYEINAHLGIKERVSWPNYIPIGQVDTFDQKVALAR
jgi:hypothetical protein